MYFMLHWPLLALNGPSKTKFYYSQWFSFYYYSQFAYATNQKEKGKNTFLKKKTLFQPFSRLVTQGKMAFKGNTIHFYG
jgi:hypothetical protein